MRYLAGWLIAITLLVAGCVQHPIEASAPVGPAPIGIAASGVVQGIGSDRMWVIVQQEAIPALGLKDGVYRYPVANGSVLNGVHSGDEVEFYLVDNRGWYVVNNVLITHSGENDSL